MTSNYIAKTSLTNGTRYRVNFGELRIVVYVVDGIKMSKSSAYRRGTRSTGETNYYEISPSSETRKAVVPV